MTLIDALWLCIDSHMHVIAQKYLNARALHNIRDSSYSSTNSTHQMNCHCCKPAAQRAFAGRMLYVCSARVCKLCVASDNKLVDGRALQEFKAYLGKQTLINQWVHKVEPSAVAVSAAQPATPVLETYACLKCRKAFTRRPGVTLRGSGEEIAQCYSIQYCNDCLITTKKARRLQRKAVAPHHKPKLKAAEGDAARKCKECKKGVLQCKRDELHPGTYMALQYKVYQCSNCRAQVSTRQYVLGLPN